MDIYTPVCASAVCFTRLPQGQSMRSSTACACFLFLIGYSCCLLPVPDQLGYFLFLINIFI
jgi:hypothetical protein